MIKFLGKSYFKSDIVAVFAVMLGSFGILSAVATQYTIAWILFAYCVVLSAGIGVTVSIFRTTPVRYDLALRRANFISTVPFCIAIGLVALLMAACDTSLTMVAAFFGSVLLSSVIVPTIAIFSAHMCFLIITHFKCYH